ncbi:MAG: hypothetical protein IJR28_07060, partial [Ottowia sp.]|nr:hypothetical protein [Ottowia sp.]
MNRRAGQPLPRAAGAPAPGAQFVLGTPQRGAPPEFHGVNEETEHMSRKLVAYFSATGSTARVAHRLARAIDAETYEIKAAQPYSAADLNWHDSGSRSTLEMADKAARPALADTDAPVAEADIVFLGAPIWWSVPPRIINT